MTEHLASICQDLDATPSIRKKEREVGGVRGEGKMLIFNSYT